MYIKLFGICNNESDYPKLQEDVSKLESWALAWQMKFNVDKCTVMHIGSGNKKCSYQLGNSLLEFTGTQKDLQIWISNDLKFEFHTLEACKKANKMLGMIKRTVIYKDPRILVSLYKSLVRPHLEYCCSVWALHYQKDKDRLQKVQHCFSRMLQGMKELECPERLKRLGLWTLEASQTSR